MTEGQSIIKVCSALVKAQAQLGNLPYDEKNPHFNSRFISLAGVLGAVRPVLAKHGLTVLQPAYTDGNQIAVSTVFLHESGEQIKLPSLSMPLTDRMTAQQLGSTVTYLRRYSLMAALGVAGVDEDDDGNADKEIRTAPQARQEPVRRSAPADSGPTRASAPSAKPAPAPAPVAEGEQFECTVTFHEEKSGTTQAGKPYVKHRVGLKPVGGSDVIYASTFDAMIGGLAAESNKTPTVLRAVIRDGRYGPDLMSLEMDAPVRASKEVVDEEIPF